MEELSMYFCLKLKERHKEYNKENTPIKFVEFLRLLQYPKKDIDAIFNTMNGHCKKRLQMESTRKEIIHRIKSIVPMSCFYEKLRSKHLGSIKDDRWKWEPDYLFYQYDNEQLKSLLNELKS